MSVYSYTVEDIQGAEASLEQYRGKVLLIVNTASKCGYTPQYEGLEQLYQTYAGREFAVLGFPCNQFGGQEPGTHEEVQAFCQLNYGVTFPLFAKTEVKGPDKHPLFAYLVEQLPFQGFDRKEAAGERMHQMFEQHMPDELTSDEIKWNFTKFLIGQDGVPIARYESPVTPAAIAADIERHLQG